MPKSTALLEWQEQVIACRNAREETEDQAWQRAAAWYKDWVRHNDYVQLTLPHLSPFIHSEARILEIGPGTGAFTLQFARTVREVVVVEPSPNMREILKYTLAEEKITNVVILEEPIETAVGDLKSSFDLAFASHSLYNVTAIDVVVRGLMRVAKRSMILMGTGEPLHWYCNLYERLKGKPPIPYPQLPQFYAVLAEMEIYADVRVYPSSYNYVFDSEDDLVDWWQRHLHLDQTEREALRANLLPLVERRDRRVGIFSQSGSALISFKQGRNWKGED